MRVKTAHFKQILSAEAHSLLQGNRDYLWIPPRRKAAVTLVAHVDTVFSRPPTSNDIIDNNGVWTSLGAKDGLGGDDRCGVYIATVLARKYDCGLLLTDDEEIGCLGAQALCENKALCKEIAKRTLCLIEVDRRGIGEVVNYDWGGESNELHKYVETRGFTAKQGSVSDVAYIAPAIARQAVNVSAGYMCEHTAAERIVIDAMEYTMARLSKIIVEIHNANKLFKRVESCPARGTTYSRKYRGGSWGGRSRYSSDYDWMAWDKSYDGLYGGGAGVPHTVGVLSKAGWYECDWCGERYDINNFFRDTVYCCIECRQDAERHIAERAKEADRVQKLERQLRLTTLYAKDIVVGDNLMMDAEWVEVEDAYLSSGFIDVSYRHDDGVGGFVSFEPDEIVELGFEEGHIEPGFKPLLDDTTDDGLGKEEVEERVEERVEELKSAVEKHTGLEVNVVKNKKDTKKESKK